VPLAGTRGLDAVQKRVHRGSTALDPGREAVTAHTPILGGHIDCLRRATLDALSLDSAALQRPVLNVAVIVGPVSATGVAWEGSSNSVTAHRLQGMGRENASY
jgi:hypothetical protein